MLPYDLGLTVRIYAIWQSDARPSIGMATSSISVVISLVHAVIFCIESIGTDLSSHQVAVLDV